MLDVFLAVMFSLLAIVNIVALIIFIYPMKKITANFCPKLSIVVPAHNEERYIENTIDSIKKADYGNERDIIIVDDGSSDGTKNIIKDISKKYKNVRTFRIAHSGKSAALNYGIKKAVFGVIVYVDADSSIGKDCLLKLVQPLRDKDIVISSGIIRARHTKNPLTWFQDIDYIASSGWRYVCSKVDATYIAPGFAAFKKDAVVSIGGFSKDTLTEDIDTTITLRKAGYGAAMTDAVMLTSVPSTLHSLIRQRIRWGRGSIQVAKKHSDLLFSRKASLVGLYSFPMHLFWYAFAILYLPFAVYWITTSYLTSVTSIFSLQTAVFAVKWFSLYGILDLLYKTYAGYYSITPLIASVIISWVLSFIYLIISMRKFSAFSWKFLVYFIMFPYYWLMFTIQGLVLAYEALSRKKGSNVWKKFDGKHY